MRPAIFTLLLAATTALAQTANLTFLSQLGEALQNAGLTQLASLAQTIINTTDGALVLSSLSDTSKNFTILAPSDTAFKAVPSGIMNDANAVSQILAYHVLQGAFVNSSSFSDSPNNTIARTLLNDTSLVALEGNLTQVVAATVKSGKITILNQNPNPTVGNTLNFTNIDVLVINNILTPPANISSVLKTAKLNAFTAALSQANLDGPVEAAHGITIFAPTDSAIQAAMSNLGSQATNVTLLQAILSNHIINGSSVYSPLFNGRSYTSAGGESVQFNVTQNFTTVSSGSSGNFTANVTQSDLLAANGVIHVINNVLLNNQTNPSAASSAFSSATQAAASPTTQTGPVGGSPTSSSGGAAAPIGAPVTLILAIVFGALIGILTI